MWRKAITASHYILPITLLDFRTSCAQSCALDHAACLLRFAVSVQQFFHTHCGRPTGLVTLAGGEREKPVSCLSSGDCDRRAPGVHRRAHHVVQRGLSLSPPSRHVRGLDVLPNLPASRPNRAPDRVATCRIRTIESHIHCPDSFSYLPARRSCRDIGASF